MDNYTYADAYADVLKIIEAPAPTFVRESFTTFRSVVNEMFSDLEEKKESIKLNTWEWFNELTGGLRMNEFSILCGPTGAGKTTLLANLATELLAQNVGVFVASVEIGSTDFMKKMAGIVGSCNAEECDITRLREITGKYLSRMNSVFSNYDSRVNHLQLMCDIYYAWKTKGIQVALIDNLNFLMDITEAKNQIVEMDRAVHEFVVFCKKVPIHVVMVMHPRKTVDGRIDSEFDIKGSSTSVQEASNVFLFNRLKNPEDAPMGKRPEWCREIKLAKVRKKGRSVGAKIIFEISQKGEMYREVKNDA